MRRVVVTGMSAITALGDDWTTFKAGLEKGENAVKVMPEWDYLDGLNTRLAAPVLHFEKPKHYKRKQVRSMGRVSLMSTRATELALEQAQLLDHPALTDGSTGISYGSSVGSTEPLINFSRMMDTGNMSGVTATSYIQTMSHTAPVNVGVFFGLTGRVITTSSACTSGSQGIGYAYEAIKFGRQNLMVAGGAEELCITEAAVFDTLYATSVKNDTPALTPRPFDKDRDGLVIGEGACTLILEELEHALARGATIYAEVIGFGCNSDGKHVTQPTAETMQIAIEQAVADANIDIAEIGYVCAHGTATDRGDIAETNATANALGRKPISSLKSYLGHTLGACGAIEAWASINMMQDNWFAPTINLDSIAEECGDLDYIRGEGREIHTDVVMSNNFAFGGINTSLIFKRWNT
ncbi:beta-ketoacyl-ACP synthase [Moritella sp. Urea-trap-13]|uniref:beta-ketoacyl-ACP synthase n=1 Tax=Moritella sp. Urea-trap-13 TaxID=2058327 RepID=UPI000C342166|nr:beta-ketoacyl-ACP synthase [Moritella sp. Urea-trap-13]PKH07064.1 beta-ketoacyl-ACP synthase II [Moritella sp. Urea-trap-13]